MAKRKTDAEYKKEIEAYGFENLEPYAGSITPILHTHLDCGHKFITRPNKLLTYKRCPECFKSPVKKKSHDTYVLELKDNFPNYVVLERYVNNSTKILHKHLDCGHEYYIAPNTKLKGVSCPNCNGLNSKTLYVIFFLELNLYKVGVTVSIKKRLPHFGYKAEIVFLEYFDTELAARDRERNLLSAANKVNTGLLKQGNTETFRVP